MNGCQGMDGDPEQRVHVSFIWVVVPLMGCQGFSSMQGEAFWGDPAKGKHGHAVFPGLLGSLYGSWNWET